MRCIAKNERMQPRDHGLLNPLYATLQLLLCDGWQQQTMAACDRTAGRLVVVAVILVLVPTHGSESETASDSPGYGPVVIPKSAPYTDGGLGKACWLRGRQTSCTTIAPDIIFDVDWGALDVEPL